MILTYARDVVAWSQNRGRHPERSAKRGVEGPRESLHNLTVPDLPANTGQPTQDPPLPSAVRFSASEPAKTRNGYPPSRVLLRPTRSPKLLFVVDPLG